MKKNLLIILFFSINSFGQIPNTLSTSEKIYGLSKFWQEVNYNFIYLNKIDKTEWNNKYKELITSVLDTKNDYEYYRELQKFCALLKDGHTNVYFPKNIEQMNTMFGDYRLFIKYIEGKAIIFRTNFSKKEEIPTGSEIIEVNNKLTAKFINEDVAPYISSSTDYVLKDWSIANLLRGLEGESFDVKIKKPNGEIISIKLTHKLSEEKEVYPEFEPQKQLLDFKWYENNTAYLSLNSFSNVKIDSLFIEKLPELYKAKSLIIDLRNNGGGNTSIGLEIFKYLTNDKTLFGSKEQSRLHIPSFKAWGVYTTEKDTVNNAWKKKAYLSNQDNYYHDFEYNTTRNNIKKKKIIIPTVVLIGHNTASAAEDFLIYADNQKHFTKIGENTFGSTGQPYMFELPGGGSARICTKKDTYPDGREFVGYGIKPDIEIIPSLNDYLTNKDVVLEKAIEFLKSNPKNNK